MSKLKILQTQTGQLVVDYAYVKNMSEVMQARIEDLEAQQSEVAARAVEEIKAELLKSTKSFFHPHIKGVFAVVENRKLREQGYE